MRVSLLRVQVCAIFVTAAGALLMTHGAYPLWSFFVGGPAIYFGSIVLEGVSMSLTSKVRLAPTLLGKPVRSSMPASLRMCSDGLAHINRLMLLQPSRHIHRAAQF